MFPRAVCSCPVSITAINAGPGGRASGGGHGLSGGRKQTRVPGTLARGRRDPFALGHESWSRPSSASGRPPAPKASRCNGSATRCGRINIGLAPCHRQNYVAVAGRPVSVRVSSPIAPAAHETLLGLLPLNTRAAQRLLQQVRPWIEPAQSYEKNQLGLGQMFFNSLRLTWCLALLADAAVLLRAHALLRAPATERALLSELAPQQRELDFDPLIEPNSNSANPPSFPHLRSSQLVTRSTRDELVPKGAADAFFAAAREPKTQVWVDSQHDIDIVKGVDTIVDWFHKMDAAGL